MKYKYQYQCLSIGGLESIHGELTSSSFSFSLSSLSSSSMLMSWATEGSSTALPLPLYAAASGALAAGSLLIVAWLLFMVNCIVGKEKVDAIEERKLKTARDIGVEEE